MQGLIHIYTGDGKGKTSTAIGLTIRAAGSGMKVVFGQFLKDGSSSEFQILNTIPNIICISCKKHFGLIKYMSKEQLEEARNYYREYWKQLLEMSREEKADMLILDEFIPAYQNDFINKEEAIQWLQHKPEKLEVVLTGRNAPDEMRELADYYMEIQKIKHPFEKGIMARLGIEM